MHGSLPDPQPTAATCRRVVLTRDDFEMYQHRHPLLWSRVAAGYLGGSMLFLGLSLTDPNMRLLQRLARAAQATGVRSSSVVVMKVPDERQDLLRFESRAEDLRRSGVTVLTIPGHGELVGVLARLRAMLRPARVILSGSLNGLGRRAASRAIQAAEFLGVQLARNDIPIVHGAARLARPLRVAMRRHRRCFACTIPPPLQSSGVGCLTCV